MTKVSVALTVGLDHVVEGRAGHGKHGAVGAVAESEENQPQVVVEGKPADTYMQKKPMSF